MIAFFCTFFKIANLKYFIIALDFLFTMRIWYILAACILITEPIQIKNKKNK